MMKLALNLFFVFAILAAACGQTAARPVQTQASPLPEKVGTATLSETGCNLETANQLPLHEVTFSLVNKTTYTGHFAFAKIQDGYTIKDVIDYWNSPTGKIVHPSFITQVRQADVVANGTREVVVPLVLKGSYALGCVYADETNNVMGFFQELKAG
jgi:hypothetical protein